MYKGTHCVDKFNVFAFLPAGYRVKISYDVSRRVFKSVKRLLALIRQYSPLVVEGQSSPKEQSRNEHAHDNPSYVVKNAQSTLYKLVKAILDKRFVSAIVCFAYHK